MKKTFGLVFVPHGVALFGSLFLHFSFLSTFTLGLLGLFGGVAHAMSPLQKELTVDEKKSLTKHQ